MLNALPHLFTAHATAIGPRSTQRFARLVLPHLDAAYNLARWMTLDEKAASAVLEDSLRRGARSSGRFRGEVTRVWLLQIVHETCVSWTDTKTGSNRAPAIPARTGEKPINAALSGLPMLMREVLVLRELEDLSYADIARIVGVSIETVVSRLALARVSIQVAPSRPSAANVVFPLADASSNAR